MFKSIGLRPTAVIVSAILITFTFFLGRRPYYNWDMFPYMAVIMDRQDVPFDSIHSDVYRAAAEYLPHEDYQAISARQPELAKDPEAFHAILKYFTIKPGYTTFAELFYRLGVHPVLATVIPSLLGYLALGIVLFIWSQSVGSPATGMLVTLLVALAPPMLDLARYSSPDMMCAALSVSAIAMILTARPTAGLFLLYMAVWVRPDGILLFLPVTLALAFKGTIRWGFAAILAGASTATAWLIIGGLGLLREYVEVDPSLGRWDLYIQGLRTTSPYLILFLIIAAGLLYGRRFRLTSGAPLIWAGLASLLFRYALHPVFEDRFNLPVYFLILMIGWETVMAWRLRIAKPKIGSGM